MSEEYALKDHNHGPDWSAVVIVLCILAIIAMIGVKYQDWHKEMEAEQTPTTQPIHK